jgi:hypothetical protein
VNGADLSALHRAEFAFPGPLRDELVASILAGTKTATAGLLREYELEGESLPKVGDLAVVVDSENRPIAVIETTEVRVIRAATSISSSRWTRVKGSRPSPTGERRTSASGRARRCGRRWATLRSR